jgi:hypothetical protein
MLKTFSAAALAAVAIAKGSNDGTSQENAVTTTLMEADGIKIVINSYNADNNGTQEIHGDLALTSTGTFNYVVYGFCIGFESVNKWDCMRVKTDLNATKIADDSIFATSYLTQDYYSVKATVGADADMKSDDTYLQEVAEKSWVPVATKSSKACNKTGGGADLQLVDCSLANVHYYRNFDTPDGAPAVQQDVKLELAKAGTEHKIFAFFGDYRDANYSTAGQKAFRVGSPINNWVAVYPAHKTAVEAANSTDTDGAGSLTAYASFIATFCYMFFF